MIYQIIKDEISVIRDKYGDERRTKIVAQEDDLLIEDLIAEDMVITLTHKGYIKRQPVDAYRTQRQGGRGVTATQTKDDDFVEHVL